MQDNKDPIEMFSIKPDFNQQNNVNEISPETNLDKTERFNNKIFYKKIGVAVLLTMAIVAGGTILTVNFEKEVDKYNHEYLQDAIDNGNPIGLDIIKDNNDILFSEKTTQYVFKSGDGLSNAAMAVEGHELVDLRIIQDKIESMNDLPQVIPEGFVINIPEKLSIKDPNKSNLDVAYDPSHR